MNAGDDQAAPERPSLQFAASRAFVSHLVGDTGIEGMLTQQLGGDREATEELLGLRSR